MKQTATLVLCPYDNYGFSVPVMFRSKAQCEGNGYSLVEYWNAAAGHHRDALRVSLSTPTTAFRHLAREYPLPARRASPKAPTVGAVNVDKLTEPVVIIWTEH